jgi:hypothetical protein
MEPTYVKFTDEDGKILVEEELVYMDRALARAQEGINIENLADDIGLKEWLPKFTEYLNNCGDGEGQLTDTHAWMIAHEVATKAAEVKKKFSPMLTSRVSTESIPSTSMSENGTG